MGTISRLAATLVVAGSLAGCAGMSSPTRYATEKHALGKVEETNDGFFELYKDSYSNQANAGKAWLYVDRGMTLAQTTCIGWLTDLTAESQGQEYAKKQLGILTVLATGVLGIVGVDSDVFSGIAVGSAFTYASMDLYRDYMLLGPNSQAITDMVERSMAAAMQAVRQNPPNNFDTAFRSLESFSRLCEPAVVHQHVIEAIKAADPQVVYTDGIDEANLSALLSKIAEKFGETIITDQQLLGLFWHVQGGFQDSDEKDVANKYLGHLAARFRPSGGSGVTADDVRPALLALPRSTRASLQGTIESERTRLAKEKDTATKALRTYVVRNDFLLGNVRMPRGAAAPGSFSVRMR